MTSLQLLASVIFAAIFATVFSSLYISYRAGAELDAFERGVEDLANRIRLLANQDTGAVDYFGSMNIPKNCELRFQDKNVIAVVRGSQKSYSTGITVSGPTLSGWSGQLKLERMENNIKVSIG